MSMRDKIANAKNTTWPADGLTNKEVARIIENARKGVYMSELIESEHIIETISAFYSSYRDYDTLLSLILAIGAEILDVSEDRMLELIV